MTRTIMLEFVCGPCHMTN